MIDRFRQARRDEGLAVLEGFHPWKHALRFGAKVLETAAVEGGEWERLTEALAPELAGVVERAAIRVPAAVFRQLAPAPPPTGVMAIAERPAADLRSMLEDDGPGPVVLLENPRSHGNCGAAIRVAAAAGAAGVITTGEHNPWHPSALVGSAGLHFALPVVWMRDFDGESWAAGREALGNRTALAVDPAGESLEWGGIPERALLIFGSERDGVSPGLLAKAERQVAIPMREGVSSLNLATAVAVVLYGWRLGRQP